MSHDYTAQEMEQIRQGRGKFAAMGATYFAGVFNDNFFRQIALLLAVAADRKYIQGFAMLAFTLPFIVFGAWAGWLADRYSKRTVVITTKLLELSAMLVAAVGIYYRQWWLMMVTLAVMATQSSLFSPAMNGSIPELYPSKYVLRANAIIRMVSTAAILIGIACAGFVQDIDRTWRTVEVSRLVAPAVVVLVAFTGVCMSLGVPKFGAASPGEPFPWLGPIYSLKTLWAMRKDKLLSVVVLAKAYFWFLGSLNILILNPLGVEQMGWGESFTSILIVIALVGIAIGAWMSGLFTQGGNWFNATWQSGLAMGVFMITALFVDATPLPKVFMGVCMTLVGISSGIFMLPPSSFVQVRPKSGSRGKIIAHSNLADFVGMLFSGPLYMGFVRLGLKPSEMLAVVGVMTLVMAIALKYLLGKYNETD